MKKYLPVIVILSASIFLAGCQLIPKPEENKTSASVDFGPMPSEVEGENPQESTDSAVIRDFFNLINEKRIPEAIGMLSGEANPDQASTQSWGVNFNSIKNVTVKSIDEWDKNSWTDDKEIYKVVLDITLETGNLSYGWYNGENTRWLEIVKDLQLNLWQINTIGTGP